MCFLKTEIMMMVVTRSKQRNNDSNNLCCFTHSDHSLLNPTVKHRGRKRRFEVLKCLIFEAVTISIIHLGLPLEERMSLEIEQSDLYSAKDTQKQK